MIDNGTREKLYVIAQDTVQDGFYREMMKNLSKFEDSKRYYNWYHGYTKMFYPFYHEVYNRYNYPIYTYATSGSFGDKFDAEKVDGNIFFSIDVNVPKPLKEVENVTLTFKIYKNTIIEFRQNDQITFFNTVVDPDEKYFQKNFTNTKTSYNTYTFSSPMTSAYEIILERKVSQIDINNLKLQKMPGFRLTWNYDSESGLSEAKYIDLICAASTCKTNTAINVEFAR